MELIIYNRAWFELHSMPAWLKKKVWCTCPISKKTLIKGTGVQATTQTLKWNWNTKLRGTWKQTNKLIKLRVKTKYASKALTLRREIVWQHMTRQMRFWLHSGLRRAFRHHYKIMANSSHLCSNLMSLTIRHLQRMAVFLVQSTALELLKILIIRLWWYQSSSLEL